MKKKIMLLCLVALLSLAALAGCGKEEAQEEATAGENMIAQAIENTEKVASGTYDMTMDMAMSITVDGEQQDLNMTSTGNVQYIAEPMTMALTMNMDMGELGSQETQGYGEVVDDDFLLYNSVDVDGNTTWYKQNMGSAAEMQQYNAASNMDIYLNSMKNFTEEGVEQVNGSEATKFTGVINGDDLQAAIDGMAGLSDQLSGLGLDEDTLSSLYADAGDLNISLWIDNKSVLPVKYEMDMTQLMQNIMTKLLEGTEGIDMTYEISNMFMSMTVTGYDNVDSIDIPEEARNAQDLTALTEDGADAAAEGE